MSIQGGCTNSDDRIIKYNTAVIPCNRLLILKHSQEATILI